MWAFTASFTNNEPTLLLQDLALTSVTNLSRNFSHIRVRIPQTLASLTNSVHILMQKETRILGSGNDTWALTHEYVLLNLEWFFVSESQAILDKNYECEFKGYLEWYSMAHVWVWCWYCKSVHMHTHNRWNRQNPLVKQAVSKTNY